MDALKMDIVELRDWLKDKSTDFIIVYIYGLHDSLVNQGNALEAARECRDALETLLNEAKWHDVNQGALDWDQEALAAYDQACGKEE